MDDDYVAQVLAKEARESSLKYSSQGLSALMPSKPAGNAPKPNTRFLRHLIKETDNHNTALKRKEERESRERMRQLKAQSSTASSSTDRTIRKSDDRNEARGSRESRREEKRNHYHSSGRRHRSRSASTEQDRSRRHRRRNEDHDAPDERRDRDERRREHRHYESSRRDRRDREKDYSRRRRDRSYSNSRSRSPRRDRSSDRHRRRRHDRHDEPSTRRRSRSREALKSRSKGDDAPSNGTRRSHRETTTRHDRPSPTTTARQTDTGNESDPLEDLVGPLPPNKNDAVIRSRGRGAYKNLSNIDAHFAPGYDPATDVQLDDDNSHSVGQQSSRRPVAGLMTGEDDWDMALEALRDRTRWKQKGEERLREAGIDDAAIDRWKNNAAFTGLNGEGNPEDVQWSKKGEGREWDRGKFVDDEGHINVRAAW